MREAELSMKRRLSAPEENILIAQSNLAVAYQALGRFEEALQMKRDAHTGYLRLYGTEHRDTLIEALNYSKSLLDLQRYEEAKLLMRKTMPVARRISGENDELTLKMRLRYASSLYADTNATLDDLREAVTTGEEIERIARRVLGGTHPLTVEIERSLHNSRARLAARPV